MLGMIAAADVGSQTEKYAVLRMKNAKPTVSD
jgi:hypothetical protein